MPGKFNGLYTSAAGAADDDDLIEPRGEAAGSYCAWLWCIAYFPVNLPELVVIQYTNAVPSLEGNRTRHHGREVYDLTLSQLKACLREFVL